MIAIGLLENTIKDYEWGSASFIQELLGHRGSLPDRAAELWVGTHPMGPSEVLLPQGRMPLDTLIARWPDQVLGEAAAFSKARGLPFLFKIIAAERPLSVQVHPDRKGALDGFLRENARGIPLDSPTRSYRDDAHKPELVCALSEFKALAGLRPAREAFSLWSQLEMDPFAEPREGTASMFRRLLAGEKQGSRKLIKKACDSAAEKRDQDPCFHWIARLAEQYPLDPGCLAPLFLNFVKLMPGEALYLPPGCLHAYLQGSAAEVMACSDNVIRGGLTNKHVDLEELMRVMRCDEAAPALISPVKIGECEEAYPAPAEEFLLSVVHINAGSCHVEGPRRNVEIFFCVEGQGVIADARGATTAFERGSSFLVPACVGSYSIKGCARLYKVTVPLPPP